MDSGFPLDTMVIGRSLIVEQKRLNEAEILHKSELAAQMSDDLAIPHEQATDLMNIILDEITLALSRGEPVRLIGFGTFHEKTVPEKKVRHPKTGEWVEAEAHQSVSFKPGKSLKQSVNSHH